MRRVMRKKSINVRFYSWPQGVSESVVLMIAAEVDNKTSYLRPTFDTIEKALEQKHRVMMNVCRKYNLFPTIKVKKQVIKENEVDWS